FFRGVSRWFAWARTAHGSMSRITGHLPDCNSVPQAWTESSPGAASGRRPPSRASAVRAGFPRTGGRPTRQRRFRPGPDPPKSRAWRPPSPRARADDGHDRVPIGRRLAHEFLEARPVRREQNGLQVAVGVHRDLRELDRVEVGIRRRPAFVEDERPRLAQTLADLRRRLDVAELVGDDEPLEETRPNPVLLVELVRRARQHVALTGAFRAHEREHHVLPLGDRPHPQLNRLARRFDSVTLRLPGRPPRIPVPLRHRRRRKPSLGTRETAREFLTTPRDLVRR